jgi:hypothetical protein
MYGIISFLLLLLPLIFQILFGIKSIADRLKLNFSKVCLISFIAQFIFSYLTFQIVSHNLRANSNGQIHCGMPLMALIVFEIFLIIILLVIILIQFFIWRSYNRDK